MRNRFDDMLDVVHENASDAAAGGYGLKGSIFCPEDDF